MCRFWNKMKYLSERLKAFQANCDVRSAEHAIIPVFKKNLSCLLIFFFFLFASETFKFVINFENFNIHNYK